MEQSKFYLLPTTTVTIGAGIGIDTGDLTLNQGSDADVVIEKISAYFTANHDFSFNFRLAGGGELYFAKDVHGIAVFGNQTLPYVLSVPIRVPKGSGLEYHLVNGDAAATDVQIVFHGKKVYDSVQPA